jgi:hypothetical protein
MRVTLAAKIARLICAIAVIALSLDGARVPTSAMMKVDATCCDLNSVATERGRREISTNSAAMNGAANVPSADRSVATLRHRLATGDPKPHRRLPATAPARSLALSVEARKVEAEAGTRAICRRSRAATGVMKRHV